MNRINPDNWTRLGETPTIGDILVARYAIPEISESLLIALDGKGNRHLLIPLESNEEEFKDNQSRGISVETQELVLKDFRTQRYIDIICHDQNGFDVFDLIGGELAVRLSENEFPPSKLVSLVISKWRRFWGNLPRTLLSKEELIGLLAEIICLVDWLIPQVGPEEAVLCWRGPFSARHDFELNGRSIEAKATTSNIGRIHRIHGLEQLSPPENGKLFLFSLQLREEKGALNTLPEWIVKCKTALASFPDAMDRFEMALVSTGYTPIHDYEYSKIKFRIIDQAMYRVEDDFPRITAKCFNNHLPDGVENIEYQINLSGFNHLKTALNQLDNRK